MTKALIPTSMTKLMRDPFKSVFPNDWSKWWKEFDDMFQDLPGFMEDGWSLKDFPQTDIIYSHYDKTVVEVMLAGYSKEQLSVEAQEGYLVISATKCEDKGCSRRATRAFKRTLGLGDGHDLTNISASFKDGLLRVEIPLSQPRQPETIKVDIK